MSDAPEDLTRQLDSFTTVALSIYDVMKAVPHPYNAVADMSNKWSHDFIQFAFKLQKVIGEAPHAIYSDESYCDDYDDKPCDCWKARL